MLPRAYAKAILRDESMHDRCPSGQGIGITADFLKMIKDKGISPKVVGVEVINDAGPVQGRSRGLQSSISRPTQMRASRPSGRDSR